MNNNSTLKIYMDGVLFGLLFSLIAGLNRFLNLSMNAVSLIVITLLLWVIISLAIKKVFHVYKEKMVKNDK